MAKLNDIDGLGRTNLRQPENAFTVVYDEQEGQYSFNLLDTVNIDALSFQKNLYIRHIMGVGEDLYSLSQKFYGTPELWWLLAESSNLMCICGDLTGTELIVPLPEVARNILEQIDQHT